jgi:hypothetical protein
MPHHECVSVSLSSQNKPRACVGLSNDVPIPGFGFPVTSLPPVEFFFLQKRDDVDSYAFKAGQIG